MALEKNGAAVADRFMKKLKGGGFTMLRPPNYGTLESPKIHARDSKAVENFLETDTFKYIMNGCREN